MSSPGLVQALWTVVVDTLEFFFRSCSRHAWSTCLTPERNWLMTVCWNFKRPFFFPHSARMNRSNTPGAPSSATSTTLPAGSLRCAPGLRPRPGRVGSCPMRWFKRRRKRVDSTTGTGRVLTDRSSCAERGTLPAPRFYPSIIRHRPTGGWLVRRPSNARKGAREQIRAGDPGNG